MSDPSGPSRPDGVHGPQRPYRTALCPNCGSSHTQIKNHGKKLGGALGACAGVLGSLSSAVKGPRIGAVLRLRAAAPSSSVSSLTTIVLGALTSGATGCSTGSALGRVIDEAVLDNYLCLRCRHSFQAP